MRDIVINGLNEFLEEELETVIRVREGKVQGSIELYMSDAYIESDCAVRATEDFYELLKEKVSEIDPDAEIKYNNTYKTFQSKNWK